MFRNDRPAQLSGGAVGDGPQPAIQSAARAPFRARRPSALLREARLQAFDRSFRDDGFRLFRVH